MPVRRIGRERESLMFSSEIYKNAVRKYLESMGYSETTDSYTEGHLIDMIFYNREIDPGREFWIEAKASKVGINNKALSTEILKLLRIWIDLKEERRFKLMIFVQDVDKETKWRLAFGEPIDKEFIDEWLSKNKSRISEDYWEIISCAQKDTIYSFFQETEINIAPAYRLEIIAEEKQKKSALSPNRKAKKLLDELERRNNLIEKKNNLILNLVKIKVPEKYLKIKSHCEDINEIWEILSESLSPPFFFDGSNICSFCSEEDLGPLKKVISGDTKYFETHELLSDNPQEFTKLLNYHIDKLLKCKGLRRYGDNTYFSTPITENEDIEERTIRSYTGRERKVVTLVFEINDTSKLYYVYHRAVKVSAKVLWDNIYVQILPKRHFTEDGWTPIEGENKSRLDRKYRNAMYNRSDTYLSWTRFWKYYLFDLPFENPQHSTWFKDFRFEEFEIFPLMGVPQPIDKDQMLLFNYMEESDDD